MAKFRSFSSPLTDNQEPISFELAGQTFNCYSGIPGRKLLEFLSAPESESAAAVVAFLDSSIVAADRARFLELTESTDTIVPFEVLSDVSAWLIGIYSGNPTEEPTPQGSSSPGQTTTPPSSAAMPQPMESTSPG